MVRIELIWLVLALTAVGLLAGWWRTLRGRRPNQTYWTALLALVGLTAVMLALAGPAADPGPSAASPGPTTTPSPPPGATPGASPVATPELSALERLLHLPLAMRRADPMRPQEILTPTPTATPTATATPSPSATPSPTATAPATPTPGAQLATTTSTPSPTPTPRRPIEKVTKMGVGIYGSGGDYLEPLFQAKPTVILLMEPNIEFAQEVRRWFPKAFIVGRRPGLDQPLDNSGPRGEAFADYVAQLAVPLKGVVDAWMSYNEVVSSGMYDRYRAYNTFQVSFARRLQGHYGIAAVAANDAVGVIQPEDYVKYFAEAIRESRYFGVHAYAPQGATSMRQEADWYTLRYRRIHQALENAGVEHGPFVMTESGLWVGWVGVVSEQEMANDFVWFTDELEKDSYVIGHAAFGFFGNGQWSTFDFIHNRTILDAMGNYWPPGRSQ